MKPARRIFGFWQILPLFLATLFFCSTTRAQQGFPYSVEISTVVGDCFNNCQAIITLHNAQGQIIQMNDSLLHPVDSISYPLFNVQYHYKNQLYNSVFYNDSPVLTMDVGTYDIGVSGYIMTSVGDYQVPVLVDTTLYGIVLTSTYSPLTASLLASIAENDVFFNNNRRERCGNRSSFACDSSGRIQLKLSSGRFPYTVNIINAQEDTVIHAVFNNRQHNGNDSLYADFRDYYTFDSLAAGTYRIVVHDACSYTIVMHHTVQLNTIQISNLFFLRNPPHTGDSNTLQFTANFYSLLGIRNYNYDYFERIFQYRFTHTTPSGINDTTPWRPINGETVGNMYSGQYCDTIGYASRYCDLYGQTVKFEMRDLCRQDTMSFPVTFTFPDVNCLAINSETWHSCIGDTVVDTCVSMCNAYEQLTLNHHIWYNCGHNGYTSYGNLQFIYTPPLHWVYTDSATGQVIKTDVINNISNTSSLTHTDVLNTYGPYHSLSLPIVRTLVDAYGCELLSRFDTLLFIRDTTTSESPSVWIIDANFNRYNYSSCFYYNRSITVKELSSPFPLYRDSVVVRLIKSPLYNKYNFTATYCHGTWTIVKDNPSANDANIITDGMQVSINSNRLSGGLYIFICETDCGSDTLQIDIDGIYYHDWEWIEEPEYLTEQECNDLFVTPISGKYRSYSYLINSQVSNDEPIVTYSDNYPSITLLSGVTGGYSSTATSMFSPFRFTIPGDYVIKMYFYGCGTEYSRIDTIHFVRIRVDFEKAYAVVCDTSANVGSVIARAIRGSRPYTYMLYSQPDLNGTLLGTNQSGLFYNVSMHVGQEMSIFVIDSCESSYYINIVSMLLSQSQLLWFQGTQPDPGACVRDTIVLEALPFNEFINYTWTGPGNFTATGQQISFAVTDTSLHGWFTVDLQNTGCQAQIKDSLYLNVLHPPQVAVSAVDTVCAGDTVQVMITASGYGTVNTLIWQETAGVQSSQNISISADDTVSIPYLVESDNAFWISEAHDQYCPLIYPSDTIHVLIHPASNLIDTLLVTHEDVLTCYGSDATLSVTSELSSPWMINWYDNITQGNLIHHDTIHTAGGTSSFSIPQLTEDTTLYVSVWNDSYCPAHTGRLDFWVNMRNDTLAFQPGQGIRFYDSGGSSQPYSDNESLEHVFYCPGANLFLIRFHSFQVFTGDTLFLYGHDGSLINFFTGTRLPENLLLPGPSITFRFVSNQTNTLSGWTIDILTPVLLTVNADVIRYSDTLSTVVCQTDVPFSFSPFTHIDIAEPGVIQLDTLLTSSMGCDSAVSLIIKVLPVMKNTVDTTICEGSSVLMGNEHYQEEGSYLCYFTAENGCDSVVTLNLDVIGGKLEIVSSEEDFCEHYQTTLTLPYIGDDYLWNTGEHTSSIEVTNPGLYTVTAHYQGCEFSTSYTISPCEWALLLPNAFSPAKLDGTNDFFCLQDRQKEWIVDFEISIYNRWGELVFRATDKNFKWDGKYKGKIYLNNVYNYFIHLTDKAGRPHSYKGAIVVVQ